MYRGVIDVTHGTPMSEEGMKLECMYSLWSIEPARLCACMA